MSCIQQVNGPESDIILLGFYCPRALLWHNITRLPWSKKRPVKYRYLSRIYRDIPFYLAEVSSPPLQSNTTPQRQAGLRLFKPPRPSKANCLSTKPNSRYAPSLSYERWRKKKQFSPHPITHLQFIFFKPPPFSGVFKPPIQHSFLRLLPPPGFFLFLKYSLYTPPPLECWVAVLQKRLAWALFVLLLATLVCYQPTELILGSFFLFYFTPPPRMRWPWRRNTPKTRPIARPSRLSPTS